eukprot:scaffold94_cov340-Prasinococcus_capsulatus_cf.AAC.12
MRCRAWPSGSAAPLTEARRARSAAQDALRLLGAASGPARRVVLVLALVLVLVLVPPRRHLRARCRQAGEETASGAQRYMLHERPGR